MLILLYKILDNISALSKFQTVNFGEILIKIGRNLATKILFLNSHVKNRPRRAVFQICICTDSQFVDLKTDILVHRAKGSTYFPC